MIEGFVENHIPKALTLHFGHLKAFSGKRTSSSSLHEPIHKASVFLLLSLRSDALPKWSRVLSAAESKDLDPFKIRVVSSAY